MGQAVFERGEEGRCCFGGEKEGGDEGRPAGLLEVEGGDWEIAGL